MRVENNNAHNVPKKMKCTLGEIRSLPPPLIKAGRLQSVCLFFFGAARSLALLCLHPILAQKMHIRGFGRRKTTAVKMQDAFLTDGGVEVCQLR